MNQSIENIMAEKAQVGSEAGDVQEEGLLVPRGVYEGMAASTFNP